MANSLLIPNTCQVPNVIFDEIMRKVSHAEFKVIMAIVRKTYGWGKDKDRISISQLVKITGVSKRQVIVAVANLEDFITVHKAGSINEYSINIDCKTGLLPCPASAATAPVLVQPLHRGSAATAPVASAATAHTKPTLKPNLTKPPDTAEAFIKWFSEQYQLHFKQPLAVKRRDIGIVMEILKQFSVERAQEIALRMFISKDQWIVKTGRDIAILLSQWNKLSIEESAQEVPSVPVWHHPDAK